MFYQFNVISLVVAVIDNSDLKNTIWFFIGSYPFMLNFKLQHVLDDCTPYALEEHWLGFFLWQNYERPSNCNTVMCYTDDFNQDISSNLLFVCSLCLILEQQTFIYQHYRF